MNYRVTHKTTYSYSDRVTLSQNEVRLTPGASPWQTVTASQITVSPRPSSESVSTDFYGNQVRHFTIEKPHRRMIVTLQSDVSVTPRPVPTDRTISWEEAVAQISAARSDADLDAQQFVYPSRLIAPSRELKEFAASSFIPGRALVEASIDLMRRIYKEFAYTTGATTTTTSIQEVLETRKGVCQDFAQVAVGCLRSLKLPARYVSGYLETIPPPGKERLIGADASHAWFSVYIPGFGWLDLDPTNELIVGERHVTVGWGRDFADVSPVRGMMVGGVGQKLDVSVDVAPVNV